MATFTINVQEAIGKDVTPYVLSSNVDSCEQTTTIRVPVPPGQSRYVTLTHVGSGTVPANDVAATINTETDYDLIQTGQISTTPSLNIEYATVTLNVFLTNGGTLLYSKQTNRTHTGNFC